LLQAVGEVDQTGAVLGGGGGGGGGGCGGSGGRGGGGSGGRGGGRGHAVIDTQLALDTLDAPANPLTEREKDVLRCAAGGAELREIAAQLHLSYGTVRNYLAAAVTKLNAKNRIDAIRIATSAGWL
jgi:DNA-binding CsgD family transcriptional regulator